MRGVGCPANSFCAQMGSDEHLSAAHLSVLLTARAKSQGSVHKPQLLRRMESRRGELNGLRRPLTSLTPYYTARPNRHLRTSDSSLSSALLLLLLLLIAFIYIYVCMCVCIYVCVCVCVCVCVYIYIAILRSRADSLRSHVILHERIAFYSAFFNIQRSGELTALPSRRVLCTPYNHAP